MYTKVIKLPQVNCYTNTLLLRSGCHYLKTIFVVSKKSELSPSGADPGGDWAIASLKPTKVTLFTLILYNFQKNIRDIRPFCRLLFCHSTAVR